MQTFYRIDPSPMPDFCKARVYMHDLMTATLRADRAWNKTQLLEALRSAKGFIEAMENSLKDGEK